MTKPRRLILWLTAVLFLIGAVLAVFLIAPPKQDRGLQKRVAVTIEELAQHAPGHPALKWLTSAKPEDVAKPHLVSVRLIGTSSRLLIYWTEAFPSADGLLVTSADGDFSVVIPVEPVYQKENRSDAERSVLFRETWIYDPDSKDARGVRALDKTDEEREISQQVDARLRILRDRLREDGNRPKVYLAALVRGGKEVSNRLQCEFTIPATTHALEPATESAFAPADKVEVSGLGLRVNGRPFFPLMGFYQSPKSFPSAKAAGLNGYFYPGDKPAPKEYLDALKAEGLYGMVPFDANAAGHPALLAWLLPHEPDGAFLKGKEEMSPAAMLAAYERIRKADPTRPVVMDWSPAFTSIPEESNLPAARKKELYPAYAKAADILTYNVYPIWGFNRPDCIDWPARAADDLKALAGPDKPFFAMIETGKGSRDIPEANQADVSADEIRAEAWMAILSGAKGIIYFTHQFKPKFNEFGPDAAKQAAIRKINEQITELAPLLLGGRDNRAYRDVHVRPDGNQRLTYLSMAYKDEMYVIVLNADPKRRACAATIGFADATGTRFVAEVVGEERSIPVRREDNTFTDDFAPLALRVYRLKPRK